MPAAKPSQLNPGRSKSGASGCLQVAAAVIHDSSGRVLLSQRPPGSIQAGLWEFPGGKLEPGESVSQAIVRELHEELGIRVTSCRPLIRIRHHYDEFEVCLQVVEVDSFEGRVDSREGQTLEWVQPERLNRYSLLAADAPLSSLLQLPSEYLITGSFADVQDFHRRLLQALQDGSKLIQLRAKSCSNEELQALALSARGLCRQHQARLLLNGPPEWVSELGLDGVHLHSAALQSCSSRPLPRDYWVAASCHNLKELEQAQRIGADFVCLSPLWPTASHPEAETLGEARFQRLCGQSNLPVYALGGVSPEDLNRIRALGAQGVAGISAFWPL